MAKKSAVLGLACLILGLLAGYFVGKQNPETTNPAVSTANSKDSESACISVESDQLMFSGFTVDGKNYGFQDLPSDVRRDIVEGVDLALERQRSIYEQAAIRALLAKERNSPAVFPTLEELFPAEINVSESDARAYFDSNRASFPKDLSFDQMKGTLMGSLSNHNKSKIIKNNQQKLSEKTFKTSGKRHCVSVAPDQELNLPRISEGRGGKQIVWVTHFFCAECRRLWPSVTSAGAARDVRIAIGGKRDDAVANEMNRGLYCASQQGQKATAGWLQEGHSIPYEFRENLGKIRTELRDTLPQKAGLKIEEYQTCLLSDAAVAFSDNVSRYLNLNNLETAPEIIIDNMKPIAADPSELLKTVSNI